VDGASDHVSGEGDGADGDAIASIHDIVLVKQTGLSEHLRYDVTERRSGLVRFLAADATAEEPAMGIDDLGDFASEPWIVDGLSADAVMLVRDGLVRVDDTDHPVRAEKTIRIGGDRVAPTLSVEVVATNVGDRPLTARFAVEWSTMLLGGGGNPAAWQESGGVRVAHDARLTVERAASMAAGNDGIGVCVSSSFSPLEDLWTAPIQTVSYSESGFERWALGGDRGVSPSTRARRLRA
jgi:hypothetical protein